MSTVLPCNGFMAVFSHLLQEETEAARPLVNSQAFADMM
jgi:hypothetical protein